MNTSPVSLPPLPESLSQGISLLLHGLLLIWAIALVDCPMGGVLGRHLGIQPRRLRGLPGILLAPLFHQDLGHAAANSVPLVLLGSLISLQGVEVLGQVTGLCWGLSGLGVWLFGRPGTVHLGASGVIFGYLGYLLLRGYFDGSALAVALALLVGLLYGGALWGLLPLQRGKSWVGHSTGFLAGVWAARYLDQISAGWITR